MNLKYANIILKRHRDIAKHMYFIQKIKLCFSGGFTFIRVDTDKGRIEGWSSGGYNSPESYISQNVCRLLSSARDCYENKKVCK